MDIFQKDELRVLVEAQTAGGLCISIYMPTYRPGRTDVQQNSTRLRKLLVEAHERLMQRGLRRPEADNYLQPVRKLLDDSSFWANTSDGLAIFCAQNYFRYYRLPVNLPELVIVANRFHVKPLLPMLAVDGRFYVMAISQKIVRLLECTRFNCKELDIAGKIPRSLAEALQFEDVDREAQYRLHMGRGIASLSGQMLSAHGAEVKETKEDLLRFFFLVDRGLQHEFLHDETAPLVIVGVDYLFPIYQKANTYKYLLDKAIEKSPDRLSPVELHHEALTAVEPYFKELQEKASRLYREFAGLKRSTTKLEEIVVNSYLGKVFILFVSANQQQWGNYDPSTNEVKIHSKEEPCDIDLLDFAAAQTLAHGGEVYAVDADKVPDGRLAAAVLRY